MLRSSAPNGARVLAGAGIVVLAGALIHCLRAGAGTGNNVHMRHLPAK